MRISLNTLSMSNSQPLRFGKCAENNVSSKGVTSASQNLQNDKFDYKVAFHKSQAELSHVQKKYDVLCNICALGLNPNYK